MKSTKVYAVVGMAILGLLLSCNSIANEDKEGEAAEAAKAWLALIDEGRYRESWVKASKYFKNATAKNKWVQMLAAARTPFGKLVSREVKSITYKKSLPGAPDGEYVVIQFTTSFENKASGIETVTPMLEKDGKWKVSGYYIK